jgi:hypothetical protein
MKITEHEIEGTLRTAPKPIPPAGLRERLIAEVRLPLGCRAPEIENQVRDELLGPKSGMGGWVRRWWPALAPGAVSLACAIGLTLQQTEIRDLKEQIQAAPQGPAVSGTAVGNSAAATPNAAAPPEVEARTQQEIARLKELASRLASEIEALERMRLENEKLRTQLATPATGFLTTEEAEALAKAREKAESIMCINNLKQLGLAVKVWAQDNGDISPPTILEMTNEMSTPKILKCPADKGHQPAETFASYTPANCSYEYLAPSTPDNEPERVLFRCPIHGHVTLNDGSVQGNVGKLHPERLVERDGKLYFVISTAPPASQPSQPPTGNSQP